MNAATLILALGSSGSLASEGSTGRPGRALVVFRSRVCPDWPTGACGAHYAILFALEDSTRDGATPGGLRPEDGRLRRGRHSRERIREAARALFRERGFDGATLRAIAARAGMGASSIYRHVESKEELLVQELADLQEEAWARFRREEGASLPTRERLLRFFGAQHELLAAGPDLTRIALRATTYPEARVARRVLALQDRTIGLLAEILVAGRMRGELRKDVDVLTAARTLFHAASGARASWAAGLLGEQACREAIDAAVDLLFRGLDAR